VNVKKNSIIACFTILLLIGIVIPSSFAEESKLPDWVKNIFVWYGEGQISEDEVLNAITFLVENQIIQIDMDKIIKDPYSTKGEEKINVGSMELNKEGGILVSEDKKFRIEFPKDAVSKPVQVSITNLAENQITEDMKFFGPLGSVYELEPDGLVLEKPATITTMIESDILPNYDLKNYDVPLIILLSRSSDGHLEILEDLNSELQLETGFLIVSGKTSHFSGIVKSSSGVYASISPMDIQSNVNDVWGAKVRIFLSSPVETYFDFLSTYEMGYANIDYYGFDSDKVARLSGPVSISGEELQPGKAIEKTGLWVCLDETKSGHYGAVISGQLKRTDTRDVPIAPDYFKEDYVHFSIKVEGAVECLPVGSPITATGTGKTPGSTGVGLPSLPPENTIVPGFIIYPLGDYGEVKVGSRFSTEARIKIIAGDYGKHDHLYYFKVKGNQFEITPNLDDYSHYLLFPSNTDGVIRAEESFRCIWEGPGKFSFKINSEWELHQGSPVYLKGERIGGDVWKILKKGSNTGIAEGTVTCVTSISESSTGTITDLFVCCVVCLFVCCVVCVCC